MLARAAKFEFSWGIFFGLDELLLVIPTSQLTYLSEGQTWFLSEWRSDFWFNVSYEHYYFLPSSSPLSLPLLLCFLWAFPLSPILPRCSKSTLQSPQTLSCFIWNRLKYCFVSAGTNVNWYLQTKGWTLLRSTKVGMFETVVLSENCCYPYPRIAHN